MNKRKIHTNKTGFNKFFANIFTYTIINYFFT